MLLKGYVIYYFLYVLVVIRFNEIGVIRKIYCRKIFDIGYELFVFIKEFNMLCFGE